MKISACIVSYNSKPELPGALDSLKASQEPVEVFVVDNQSQDGSAAWVLEHAPWATLIEMPQNLGFGGGNNAVLPYLKSNYHLIMNPDITFDPSTLKVMIQYMDEHPQSVILTPKVLNADGTEQYLPKKALSVHYLLGGRLERLGGPFKRWRDEYTCKNENITQPVAVDFATGCFLLIRTQAFMDLRGFDQRFFMYQEDTDLSRRAQALGEITYHPGITVNHLWRRENTRTLRGNLRQIRSVAQFFNKWGWKW